MRLRRNTPIELYDGVYVKRDDLCCPAPGPSLAKMRGVLPHVKARPEQVIAVLDAPHSRGGWATAAACAQLGSKRCVAFYAVRKAEAGQPMRTPQRKALELGATVVPLKAEQYASILNARAKTYMAAHYDQPFYMMPDALRLPETVAAVTQEVLYSGKVLKQLAPAHVVIPIGTGTMAAGVMRGLTELGLKPHVWLVMGYSRPTETVLAYLTKMGADIGHVDLVDELYSYRDVARGGIIAPFPACPYYELKAWVWLIKRKWLRGEVLFWNMGD